MLKRAEEIFDWMFQDAMIHRVERFTFYAAALGFFLHLFLIFLQRNFSLAWPILKKLDSSYLSAMYTPFSFILFFEVLMLVYHIPSSITHSIAKQFEIVSLIVIRRVFKDIALFEQHEVWSFSNPYVQKILLDMSASLLMFFLILLFYLLRRKNRQMGKKAKRSDRDKGSITTFIRIKKFSAVFLTVVLLALSTYSLINWLVVMTLVPEHALQNVTNVNKVFYQDFFTVMVLFDVLILIVSFSYSKGYPQVFRNAGFVIATVLIRIAFHAPTFYNIFFLLGAILFGTLVLALYTWFVWFDSKGELRLM